MTTIPNVNIVVQQAGAAHEAQTHRNQPHETVAAPMQQAANEAEVRTTVQQSEAGEKLKADEEKRRRKDSESRQRKKKKRSKNEDPDGPGYLLDTTA